MKAGLNLYSVKKLLQTEESFIDTLKALKDMGYDYVQYSGSPYDPEKIHRIIKATGMPIVLTHVPMDLILNQTEKLVEEHLSFGCKNIGLGAMPEAMQDDETLWKNKIEELNNVAIKMKSLGAKFFYHNHHFEFQRFSTGETVFEYMKKNAPEINFTLDSYWVQYGGANPETFADDLVGRIECVHLKDYMIEREPLPSYVNKPVFAPVGKGTLNMPEIINKWTAAGAKYFLVEQDNASSFDDPLAQVKQSIDYLKKI